MYLRDKRRRVASTSSGRPRGTRPNALLLELQVDLGVEERLQRHLRAADRRLRVAPRDGDVGAPRKRASLLPHQPL